MKNGAGIDKDIDLPIPVIGSGRGMKFLIPFFDEPRFARTASGCMRRCLAYYFNYTLEDWYCQMVYGDRNLRPLDEDTGTIPKFAGILKGFFESDGHSSQTKKVNRRHIWNKENYDTNRIKSAANMKLGKYTYGSLYFAKVKDSDKLKIGFTQYDDVTKRLLEHDNLTYEDIVKVTSGNGNDIILLERDIKLKFNLPDELFSRSIITDILEFIYNYPILFKINKEDITNFICR
jgi:hypothetical protein